MKSKYGVLTKSNRAIEAEKRGLVTFSNLKAWEKRAVLKGYVEASEWHHTSSAANKTYYYNLKDFLDLNKDDFKPEKIKKEVQADLTRLKIKIVYDEMIGGFTRGARKKFETVTKEGLDVRKKDNVIFGADGRRLDSNNKTITFLYKKPYAKKWKEISLKEVTALGYKLIDF